MTRQSIRMTGDDRVAAGIRIVLGILFVMTGVMKLFVPSLGVAFGGQLAAANIPFLEVNVFFVPLTETGVGVAMLIGFYTRIATVLIFGIMIVATYVHLVVNDPALFPLQPEQPVFPVVVMILSIYVLSRGGGSVSADFRASADAAR